LDGEIKEKVEQISNYQGSVLQIILNPMNSCQSLVTPNALMSIYANPGTPNDESTINKRRARKIERV
jgi:hypothetical protein